MCRFEEYYNKFLGVNNNEITEHKVFESKYRDMPLNNKYFYPIIISNFNDSIICSCSSKFSSMCKSNFDGSMESISSILKAMNINRNKYRFRKMRRYSIESPDVLFDTKAEVLTEDIIRKVNFQGIEDKENYIRKKGNILQEKRQFFMLKDGNIAATAFISEVYSSGCNIVVYTSPNYRKKGYGKEVVKACINWCHQNNLLPIYLVEEENANSIKLVESLGLELKSHEWIISE
ncbi:RimJ/RimL family protein N-acetyltransferase [Clostridium punense]|uniref:RimJ/RimL family protein N-acetyltransferase n=2 Tax=Clostridium TaxID=1485 RepID=A0ABS4KAF0_9CLOT|nr:GNAT family N-acetyltransferase [Clostridium punense]MBP2024166.1 RimJ/RimL family protein N-acetyltransferase [Clostridium punense]